MLTDRCRDPLNFRQGMPVELLQSGTEIVQSRLAIRRFQKPVLGALAPTIPEIGTLPTVFRQRLGFCISEPDLLAGADHLHPRLFVQLTQAELGIDIMAAGIRDSI